LKRELIFSSPLGCYARGGGGGENGKAVNTKPFIIKPALPKGGPDN